MGDINSHFFLPFENPIGFGLNDFIELAAALVLILFLLAQRWVQPAALRLARKPGWSMLLVATAPVLLRSALLGHHPVPSARTPADYSFLLLADTVSHLRLVNPPHSMFRFFETIWVSQQPAYNSIFPLGQGIALAFGRLFFGDAWAGVISSVSGFCGACYWMLRGWTTPGWALLGGVIAVLEWGPLSAWMNSYSGGALPAAAICVVAGSLPRLRRDGRIRDGILLGLGLALALLTSVHVFVVLLIVAGLFFIRAPKSAFAPALLFVAVAVAVTGLQNHEATGTWTTRPEAVYRPITPEQVLASRVEAERDTYQRFSPFLPAVAVVFGMALLKAVSRWPSGREAARLAVLLCFTQFLFWFMWAAFTAPDRSRIRPHPPGDSLIFVRYGPQHRLMENEWVYNDADIDSARAVWARDLGPAENAKLCRYYPSRSVWLVDADAPEPVLAPYDPAPPAPAALTSQPVAPPKTPTTLRFEEIPDVK